MNVEIVGFIAGTLVAIALLPQIIQSLRTRSSKDVSLGWIIISVAGQFSWLTYGILIDSLSLIVMSSITLLFAVTELVLKLKYGMNK